MAESRGNPPKVSVDLTWSRAHQHLSEGNFGRAFADFLICLRQDPHRADEKIETAFVLTLVEWSEQLASRKLYDELLTAYKIALELLPLNEILLLNFSSNLYKISAFGAAALCLRRALQLNPDSVVASEYLENVMSTVLERWHFMMLNDVERNKAFQRAIDEVIGRGHDVVLDIGTGTGILSMFAVRSGATYVYACEMKEPMCDVASKCLEANHMLDKVILINAKSTELKIPEQIPERVSLVITEIFDAGLFGEQIIETLIHAWEHLLLPVSIGDDIGGTVLPKGATVWACVIESHHVRRFSRVLSQSLKLWNVCRNTSIKASTEYSPYSTERLSRIYGGYRALTSPIKIMDVDFNDVEKLRSMLNYKNEVTLTSIADGILDAIVVWFDLHLCATETISTGPDSTTCWEVAVYHNEFHNQDVTRGDKITLQAKYIEQHLSVTFSSPRPPPSDDDDDDDDVCIYLEREKITQLNDMVVQNALKKSLCAAVHKLTTFTDEIHVIVASSMPLLCAYACSLDCVRKIGLVNEDEMNLLKKIAISKTNLNNKLVVANFMPLNEDSEEDTWNILVADVVHSSGLLNGEQLRHIGIFTGFGMRSVRSVIPSRLRCVAVLVESDVLTQMHRVVNTDKTLGLEISDEINVYCVSLYQDLDLTTLPHEKLSDVMNILDMDFVADCDEGQTLPSYLMAFTKETPVKVKKSGTMSAIAFWFEVTLLDDIVVSTLDPTGGGYWNQAAFVLPNEIPATTGQTVTLKTVFNGGHFKLSLTTTTSHQ